MSVLSASLLVRVIDQASGPARDIASNLNRINKAAGGAATGSFSDRMASAQQRVGATIAQNNQALANARGHALDAVAAFYVLKNAIAGPVQAAMQFESAMADVRKVVDFPTPQAFEDFKDQLVALSREVPLTVNGLAEIAAAAGQAGIAGDDLVKFTEAAAKVSTAFDISASEAGDALAKLKTALGYDIDQTVLLTDAINHLSNSQASSAPEILDVVRRVGAQATLFGFTAEQTAAYASAMIAAGAESEVAATSFRNMGNALTRGGSATKRQQTAFKKLGLNAKEVAANMQRDANGTVMDVLERLASLPKETQAAVSSDLFGNEARALGPLSTNLDLVRDSLALVADKNDYAGSSFHEFEVRAATFQNKLALLTNKLTALSIVVGNAIIPALSSMIDAIGPVIDKVTEFAAANPELVASAVAVASALIGIRIASAGLKFIGLLGKGGALSMLSTGLKAVTAAGTPVAGFFETLQLRSALAASATGKMPGPFAKLGDALLLLGGGPKAALSGVLQIIKRFGLIGLAVGAAIKFVIDNFDGFKAMLAGFGEGFMASMDWMAFNELKDTLGTIFGPIASLLKPVTDAFAKIFGFIAGDSMDIGASETEWKSWGQVLGGGVADGVNAVVSGIQQLIDFVKNAIEIVGKLGNAIASLWGAGDPPVGEGAGGGRKTATGTTQVYGRAKSPGHRAGGGPVWPGGSFMVGDGGEPEVFTPDRGGNITPLSKIGGGPVTIGPFYVSGNDPAETARHIRDILSEEIDRLLRGSFSDAEARV